MHGQPKRERRSSVTGKVLAQGEHDATRAMLDGVVDLASLPNNGRHELIKVNWHVSDFWRGCEGSSVVERGHAGGWTFVRKQIRFRLIR